MFKGERQRSRSTNDCASRSILGTMTRAHKLILGLIPRDNTTQMGTNGIEGIILEICLIIINNEISSITSESLNKFTRTCEMRIDIFLLLNIITQSILRDSTTGAGAARLGHEEIGKRAENAQCYGGGGAEEEDVHGVTLRHVRDEVICTRGCHAR